MLAIGRITGQRIVVQIAGVEVWITLLDVSAGRKAKLGFEAPQEVKIFREELLTRKPQDNSTEENNK